MWLGLRVVLLLLSVFGFSDMVFSLLAVAGRPVRPFRGPDKAAPARSVSARASGKLGETPGGADFPLARPGGGFTNPGQKGCGRAVTWGARRGPSTNTRGGHPTGQPATPSQQR